MFFSQYSGLTTQNPRWEKIEAISTPTSASWSNILNLFLLLVRRILMVDKDFSERLP